MIKEFDKEGFRDMEKSALTTLSEAADDHGEIVHGDNLHPLIEEALAAGLIRVHPSGKMKMTSSNEGPVSLLGNELPVIGKLCSVYIFTDAGHAALR